MRAEKVVRVRPFWVLSLLLALRPLQVTSVMLLSLSVIISQAVWARCWWALVSRWPPRPQPAPHHPEGPVTLSQAVVCLNNGAAKTIHDYNFRCVHHSTINLKWLRRSVLDGEYPCFSFYLICPVHFWHATRLTEFVTIFCKSEIMKRQWWSRRTFWDKPNWCPSAECSVLWQPPNAERLPNKFLVILN